MSFQLQAVLGPKQMKFLDHGLIFFYARPKRPVDAQINEKSKWLKN